MFVLFYGAQFLPESIAWHFLAVGTAAGISASFATVFDKFAIQAKTRDVDDGNSSSSADSQGNVSADSATLHGVQPSAPIHEAVRTKSAHEEAEPAVHQELNREPPQNLALSQPTQSDRIGGSTENETLTTRDGSVTTTVGDHRDDHGRILHADVLQKPLLEPDAFLDPEFHMNELDHEAKERLEKTAQISGRLQEIERLSSLTINLADQTGIRQLIATMQNLIDELGVHRLELQQILTHTVESIIYQKGIQSLRYLERILESCKKRKLELTELLNCTCLWEQFRSEVELWLVEGNERLQASENVNNMDRISLDMELKSVNNIAEGLEHMKQQMAQLNERSNHMVDRFLLDDGHIVSQQTSKINTTWIKFNESMCIRRAVLEASLRSRNGIYTTLAQLDEWLDKQLTQLKRLRQETDVTEKLKDTTKRIEWMDQERKCQAENDAHKPVISAVRDTCKKLLSVLEAEKERQDIHNKFEKVENKWWQVNDLDEVVRNRLQDAQEECEKLTKDLSELLHWTDMQISTILHDQPVGGELAAVQRQNEIVQQIEKAMEIKDREVADCIQLAHSYLMQHDLRPTMNRPSVLDQAREMEKSDAELEKRRIGVRILTDSERLKNTYDNLRQHVTAWQRVVVTAQH